MIRRFAALAFLGVGLTYFAAACGGGSAPKTAQVTAGEMPEGESWTGVYFHPLFGYLHLVEEGDTVAGRWKRADGSAWGELTGTKTGNLYHYTWTEHKVGLVGPSANSTGKGYFVYKPGKEKGVAELDGQYGLNGDEVGSDWHCIKQQRMQSDPKSINGDTGGMAPPAANTWQ